MWVAIMFVVFILCCVFVYAAINFILQKREKKMEKFTNDIPDNTPEPEMNFSNDNVEIKKSCMGDRGTFAKKDIKKGDIVESCPVILEKRENINTNSEVDDYVFSSGRDGEVAVAFGYCSMFNHDSDPNVEWKVHPESKKLVLTAKKDIMMGEEMFVSYGDNYWKTRNVKPANCTKPSA